MNSCFPGLRSALLAAVCLWTTAACASGRAGDPREDLTGVHTTDGPDGTRHVLSGRASWYGERHHGRRTACGAPFDMNAFTAAHKTLPFHTLVRVIDPHTRKEVVVRITDRGPYSRGRVIDLSRAAATDLGILSQGTVPVSLEVLAWGDGSRCE